MNLKSENLSLRVLSGKQIDDLLDRSVGFFISGLVFAGGSVAWGGFTVEEAVGQWATDTLVEENEHEGDTGPFIGEPVGVTEANARSMEGMGFEFAQVMAELGKGCSFSAGGGGWKAEKDGLVDLYGSAIRQS